MDGLAAFELGLQDVEFRKVLVKDWICFPIPKDTG